MMKSTHSLDERVDLLVEQVMHLKERVNELGTKVAAMESGTVSRQETERRTGPGNVPQAEKQRAIGGMETFLPRIAAICFMLVAALILRTVTDNGVIGMHVGSFIGVGYAVLLIAVGWNLYRKASPLASVFPACGLLLLFTIIMETHARFESLSTVGAYAVLFVAMVTIAGIALRFKAGVLLSFGTIGGSLVGMAIDFPYPNFSLLGGILVLASCIGYIAARKNMCPALRWVGFLFSVLFLSFWAYKLNVPAACDEPTGSLYFLQWFFPYLFVLWIIYPLAAAIQLISTEGPLDVFNSVAPAIGVACVFLIGQAVIGTWYKQENWFTVAAILIAAGHLGIAAWQAMRRRKGAPGVNVFVFAAFLLLSLALPDLLGMAFALPILSGLAFVTAVMSGRWRSGGMRVTSYFFQVIVCLIGVKSGLTSETNPPMTAGLIVSGVLSLLCLAQFAWCRANKSVAEQSSYFSWMDKEDFSAVVLLLAGLINGFCMLRLGLYGILSSVGALVVNMGHAFRGGQSVIIDLSVVLLMLLATRLRNKELLVVAVGVSLLGAVKVFVLDLFGIKGVPLVFSVFSFGLVAASWSIVLKIWKKNGFNAGKKEPAGQVFMREKGS